MKIITCFVLLLVICHGSAFAATPVAGDVCLTSGEVSSSINTGGGQNTLWCNGTTWQVASVIVGDSVATCDATTKGTLKYDGTSTWSFCNGTGFVPLNTVGGVYKTVVSLGVIRTNTTASTCTAPACAAGYTSKGCQWGDGNYTFNNYWVTAKMYADYTDRVRDNGFNDACTHTLANPNPSGEYNQTMCGRLCAQ